MKKLCLLLLAVFAFSSAAEAKDLSGVRIYINPGHGGFWNGGHDSIFNDDGSLKIVMSNDRNVPTIPFEPLDTNGFWESRANLIKGLELKRLLENAGATVAISRVLNREEDDLPLGDIGRAANAFKADAFISIHSNAAGPKARVNYFLNLYNKDANNIGKRPALMALSQDQASVSIPYLMDNDITVWSPKLFVAEDKKFLTYSLGVLRYLDVPGFLVEGTFHDYEPEAHRLLNVDYVKTFAWNLYRFYCDYFGADMPSTGVISGAVKDKDRIIDHKRFNNWRIGTHDMKKPINGAKITLFDANGNEVGKYTTDNNYNGVFVFWDVKPGKYVVKMEADGYNVSEKAVEVEAGKMCDFVELMKDPTYKEPKLIAGYNKTVVDMTTTEVGAGRYRLTIDLERDADNIVLLFKKNDRVLKEVPMGAKSKGEVVEVVDLNDINSTGLFWSADITYSK